VANANKKEQRANDIQPLSIVIPCVDTFEAWKSLLEAIEKLEINQAEIIICLSGPYVFDNISKIEAFKKSKKTSNTKYQLLNLGTQPVFPGKARNQGILSSSYNTIGFLDTKTKPCSSWPLDSFSLLKSKNSDIILGKTKYIPKSNIESLFIDCTYGRKPLLTIPGTIAKREIFSKVGLFLPNARTGEDTDWIERVKNFGYQIMGPQNTTCKYLSTPNTLKKIAKKWFFSYYKACTIVPHLAMQRLYYLAFFSIITLLLAYRWNALIAGWNTDSPLYLMYPTRATLIIIFLTYIAARGLVMPLKKEVPLRSLLPLRFLAIAFMSGILDITKAIAYASGILPRLWR